MSVLQRGEELGFNLSLPSHSTEDAPLIVLLGWFGCQDRYLKKYSDFLLAAGYPTLRAICPPKAVFYPTPTLRKCFAEDLLRFIGEVNKPPNDRPVIFYVFSNGGGFVIKEIEILMGANNSNGTNGSAPLSNSIPIPRIIGTIYDSAPCYMHASVGARAIGEGKPLLVRILLAAVFYLSIAVSTLLHPFWPQKYWRAMKSIRLGGASLYLYSATDQLCDVGKLEDLIAARKSAGHDVRYHRWEDAPHVGLLRWHQVEYEGLVFGFIQEMNKNVQKVK